jgi:hypothetical protein
MDSANQFLREVFLPEHNARFAKAAEREGSAFTPLGSFALNDVLCIQEERVVGKDNTVRYSKRILQINEDKTRTCYAKCSVRVHEYPDGALAVFYGPRKLGVTLLSPAKLDEDEKPKKVGDTNFGRAGAGGEAAASPPAPAWRWYSGCAPAQAVRFWIPHADGGSD